MKTEGNQLSVVELATLLEGIVYGDPSLRVRAVASLAQAGEGEVAFVGDAKSFESARNSRAACLITSRAVEFEGRTAIEVANPKLAFALVAALLHPRKHLDPMIHPTAIVSESALIDSSAFLGAHVQIGERTTICAATQVHSGVSIGDNVSIGNECTIHPNAVIYDNVTIRDRVVIHAGVVIGADGFGYVRSDVGYHKFPQIGTVLIEDDVEIGANSCIDRGALGQTRIGRGTKIDNLVQIAHNVNIGERVVIAAQTGISGSVTIEDDVVIGGQVGFGDHIHVQSGAVIGSKAGILPGKIVRPGVWWGVPIRPLEEYKRMNALMGRLPDLNRDLREVRARLKEIEERIAESSANESS
jgi:UDP-3-O-[3-hydroxymyristoyl] glucosamine N-acyltransferase